MSTVTRARCNIAGVAGVRFFTDARPGSPEERILQRIQAMLSGDIVFRPAPTTVAHVAWQSVRAVNAPPYSIIITLWVPKTQESQAASRLRAEGFDVE